MTGIDEPHCELSLLLHPSTYLQNKVGYLYFLNLERKAEESLIFWRKQLKWVLFSVTQVAEDVNSCHKHTSRIHETRVFWEEQYLDLQNSRLHGLRIKVKKTFGKKFMGRNKSVGH